jgi:hypothetical protein
MAYNLLGQQGPKGSRNPDPNLTDAQATYLYDTPPGQGDNKGLTAAGKPVDKSDVQEKLEEVGVDTQEEEQEEEVVVEEEDKPKVSGRDDVRNAQTLLKNAGFDPGPIDGLIGPLTRGAATRYIDAAKGQDELNKRRREVGFILGIEAPDTTTTDDDGELEETEEGVILYDADGNKTLVDPSIVDELLNLQPPKFFRKPPNGTTTDGKTFNELLEGIEFGPSISADATSYEVDKINAELGLSGSAFGSALSRAENRIEQGLYTEDEYNALIKSIGTSWIEMMNADKSVAARLGSFVNLAATAAGVTGKAVSVAMEEVFGAGLNTLYDIVEPDVGGSADAFIDAALGKPGENVFSDWWIDKYGTLRYDAFTNSMVDVSTGETVASIGNAQGDQETKKNNEENITTAPGGNGGTGAVDEGPLYWGRYDSGSWATSTKPGKPEGFKWAWELNEFPDKNEDLYTSDKSIEDILGLVGEPEVININNQMITLYKRGESPITVPATDAGQYLSRGWSTTQPVEGGVVDIAVEGTEEVGPGQVVSDKLNEFNNVPQNSILIEAGGQLFLGYEVPGAYGQMYNGNPIFMLYEVLGNDVFEAGILTQGASPQINVSLGSLEDLNQYGIIVGGTDELTDDVEHPFIRFTENFEAGKRVNPWLNDTEINPNTGVTYQQEAIEFLAEQALEQWTPETTQVRYEGSDWYRKSTTAQKTWLTTLLTQPQQANQNIQDKQIEVKIAMEANGIASPPDALVNWVAEKAVTGMWTQVYTDQQIALLADPYKPGTRDTGMVNFIEGVGVGTLDRLTVGEKTVRDLYRRYLGPSLGNASDTEIAEKAGQLRSDPDAEEQLKSYLEQQRLAMFGNYTNPTLTYNDIVQPYKNLVNQVWGQEVDETQDWFIKMVQDNDIEKAYTTLRQKGMEQGVERVQDQALNDLQRGIGQGQVAPQLGANT